MNDAIVKHNLDLVASVTRYILERPDILDRLPEDDRELSQYNLDLLARRADPNKAVVIVRLDTHQTDFESAPPQVYVPIAA